jgi:hypothetical protein
MCCSSAHCPLQIILINFVTMARVLVGSVSSHFEVSHSSVSALLSVRHRTSPILDFVSRTATLCAFPPA